MTRRDARVQEELARRIRTVPGVTAAGGISRLPATGHDHSWGTSIDTGPRAGMSVSRRYGFNLQQRIVSGGLFEALGIAVLAGRTFGARDSASAPSRAVVSANFGREAYPCLPLDGAIGVVGDVALDAYGAPTLVDYQAHRQFAGNRHWALAQEVATELPRSGCLPRCGRKLPPSTLSWWSTARPR